MWRLVEVYRAAHRAALSFSPLPYPGKLTLFRAAEAMGPLADLARRDSTYGWGSLAGEMEVRTVPGQHTTLVRRPWVAALAVELADVLNRRVGPEG